MAENLTHKQALEAIANFNGDVDFREAVLCLTGIAKNALNPNRKETLLEHIKHEKQRTNDR